MSPQSVLNRTLQSAFLDDLDAVIVSASAPLGLLLVQLKDISELNLAFGYRVVDLTLTALAERLAAGFARTKVVRVGTGRFAVVLEALKSDGYALLAANKVQRLVEAPFQVEQCSVKVDVVQGVALAPLHATNGQALFRCAETALELARDRHDGAVLYSAERVAERTELHRIDVELGYALQDGRVETWFQPQIDLRTGRPSGAEALLRCRGRDGAWIAPELLVRSAERNGRLAELTRAVFNTALRCAAEWPEPHLRLSVNASTHNLKDRDFVMVVEGAAGVWNRPLDALTIEITETAFIDEPQKSLAAMRSLRELGARVAIDDFGTGYSSLSYFKDIPANELKVDKTFVLGMLAYEADRRIVSAVIHLAHAFGLEVVAEGLEDEATLELLRGMECDVVQGFLLGRPMSPAVFADWLGRASAAAPLEPEPPSPPHAL